MSTALDFRSWLDQQDDRALLPVALVRERLITLGAAAPEVLSTKQAAQWFGYSPKSWLKWVRAGLVPGAWQDGDGGPWRLPRAGCEAKIGALKVSADKRRGLRGPRSKAAPPQAFTARAPSVSQGPVLVPGSQVSRRRTASNQKSGRSQLATFGRTN